MLSSIRKRANSWVVKILFAALIVAFAVWGIGDVFRSQQVSPPIVEIGDGYAYTQMDFDREMRLALQRVSQMQGMQVTPALFAQFGGAQRLVDQAEMKGLLQVYGHELGFQVPLATAAQYVETDPEFAGATGRFDRQRFEYLLRQLGQSEEQYVADVQGQMRSSYLLAALAGPMTAPEILTKNVYAYTEEMRSAETVLVANASITDVAAPDEATLTKWHSDHAVRYQAPEFRAGLLVQMTPADFIADVAVSDEEIEGEYQNRLAEFSTPETRSVEQVVVQDPAVADKIITAVKGGTAFGQAVRDATQGDPVSLGTVTKDKLPADIADAVFALGAGSVSAPLKSPFGIHVAFVSTVNPATTKALSDVEGEIRNSLALGRAAEAMESVRVQLEDELAGGASLADTAEKLGLKQQKFEAIDSAGQDRSGNNLGIPQDAVNLIFETQTGEPGYVTALSDGTYAVAQVDSVTEPALKPLAEVRDQAVKDWTEAQQEERAKARAQELADKVKGGADLKTEAEALGLAVKASQPFHRGEGDPDNGVPPSIANTLFTLKVGEVAVGQVNDGAVVARVTEIKPADPATEEVSKDLGEKVKQTLANDLRQVFTDALRSAIPVTRDDSIWQRSIELSAQQ